MTTTETSEHFKVGERVKVYQRPIQQEGFEGIAKLIEFVGNDYHEGFPVERWNVRFDNEMPIYERIIFKNTSSLLSGGTQKLHEPSDILKNLNGTVRTGLDAGVNVEYDFAFKHSTIMILFNPRTGTEWHSSEITNLKGMKILVYSDQQADWVKRTNGVPVKAAQKLFREMPKVAPKVHIFDIAPNTLDRTENQTPGQGVSQ